MRALVVRDLADASVSALSFHEFVEAWISSQFPNPRP
jgi:hypothetical protein